MTDSEVPDAGLSGAGLSGAGLPGAALSGAADTGLRRIWPAPAIEDAGDDEIASWYQVSNRAVPWCRVNFVSSLDGSATREGLSGGLSTPPDKRVFDILRRLCDVVVVGAGTVRAEGYGPMRLDDASVAWRLERGLSPHPVFAIVSGSLDVDPAASIFEDAPVRPLVITGEAAPAERRAALSEVADVLVCGGSRVDTAGMLRELAERGLPQVQCEGGPHLFGTMIADDTVDELCLTMTPLLVGGFGRRITDGLESTVAESMQLQQVLASAGTLILRYRRAFSQSTD